MTGLLVRMALRERLASPGRLRLVYILLAAQSLALFWFGRDAGIPWILWDSVLIWAIGSGVVGQELATGSGALVLARPVGRTEYVVAKWLALVILALGVLVIEDLVALAGLIQRHGLDYADGVTELCNLGSRVTVAVGAAAVVVACSVAVRGGSEAGVIVAGWAGVWMLNRLGEYSGHPILASAGRWTTDMLIPGFDVAADFAMHPFPWSHAARFALGVAVSLTLAAVVLNRREVQYGAA